MTRISFIPGVVATPAAITIPNTAPDIDVVLAAQIVRIPAAQAAHAHNMIYKANPAANAVTMAANSLHNATAGDITVAGAGADGGIQNNAALTGADPTVAAAPTKLTSRTLSLSVNTALGDILVLDYMEVGVLAHVS